MPYADPTLIRASSEFVALCQTQISLLNQGLGAAWSAVYLTIRDSESPAQELVEAQKTKLIPVVSCPSPGCLPQEETCGVGLPASWEFSQSNPRLLSAAAPKKAEINYLVAEIEQQNPWQRLQIVLPLIYDDLVMGLLVTRRQEREWNSAELVEIEKIARTIAIACFLDQREFAANEQLRDREKVLTIEREKLDDFLHQLRNPLTALRTFSKLLLKSLLPEDRNYTVAKSMLRESERMQELVEEFEGELDHGQIDTPMLRGTVQSFLLPGKLNLVSLGIREVLEPLLISAQAIASEKGITLTADFSGDLPLVKANSKALREVLNNLIDNALKYTPRGGKVDVQIVQKNSTPPLQGIRISDTGLGIPEADRGHIFERHYRGVQEEGNIAGSGLGLAIAKQLIEQMYGKIELINSATSNAGTTFIVWLTLADTLTDN